MNTDSWNTDISNLLNDIRNIHASQTNIDLIYSNFCTVILSEMDKWLSSNSNNKNTCHKVHKYHKPYWNRELSTLWKNMKEAERAFLKCKENINERRELRQKYFETRQVFDRNLKKTGKKL